MDKSELVSIIEIEIKEDDSEIGSLNEILSQDDIPTWRRIACEERKQFVRGRRDLAEELLHSLKDIG